MTLERPKTARARRLLALGLGAALAATGSAARAAAPNKPRTPATARDPGEESLAERRAVRGVPVDDVATPETSELRELRRFEEQAFPRTGAPRPSGGDATLP